MSQSRNRRGRRARGSTVDRAQASSMLQDSTTPGIAAELGAAAADATPEPAPNQPSTAAAGDKIPVPIGVGIDTSRYGHYACFLRADLQPAAADLPFAESGPGYQELRQRLDSVVKHYGAVHFHFRLDIAGSYADNLLAFLHTLAEPKTISCGDPQRNKNYRVAIFGQKKSDPIESAACARYALTEKPKATPVVTPPLRVLCQIASRLESQTRHCTRLVNQLHNLLARAFPELSLLVKDISTGWVLTLIDRYPTAAKLAGARPASLERIPYLPHEQIPLLLGQARSSVASLTEPFAEELVRDQVRQLKQAHVRRKSLEKMLATAYRQLPEPNHLDTITGFGEVTAAVLTAKIVDAQRFVEPSKLVGFFGIFPVEDSSGIDRDGKARGPKRMVMSKRGNDLVRRYLYMAALSALKHNPAVRPLYLRVLAKHPDQPAIAVGHAMRKLLHLALAVWQSGKPFDPEHYPWGQPAHLQPRAEPCLPAAAQPETHAQPASSQASATENPQAAGHKVPQITERSVVTAACGHTSVDEPSADGNAAAGATERTATPPSDIHMSLSTETAQQQPPPSIDFAHLKTQLPLQRLLEHLGLYAQLRGRGTQRRGPCPVHAPNDPGKARTFSVHLQKNVFQCFDPKCAIKGDIIDLWAALKGRTLRQAAVDLVQTFALEPAPRTEKRHG